MTRTPFEIAADAEAWSICYAEACSAHATAQARSDLAPDDDLRFRLAQDSKVAADNVLRRLLDACNALRDAGAGIVAENIYRTAYANADLAENLAFKAELSSLRGAA